MSDYKELLIGCGNSRDKRIVVPRTPDEFQCLHTIDIDERSEPDMVWDLNDTPWPYKADSFDEIHAYEVLEHLGAQGDYLAYFATFSEVWRLLRPGGLLCATCPSVSSPWLWGDPGHTRVVCAQSLVFLCQDEYTRQVDGEMPTSMTDYRGIYTADFERLGEQDTGHSFQFVLKAVKPSRLKRG